MRTKEPAHDTPISSLSAAAGAATGSSRELFVFDGVEAAPWWRAARTLERALAVADPTDRATKATAAAAVAAAYRELFRALAVGRYSSVAAAAAADLVFGRSVFGEAFARGDGAEVPTALRQAALRDLDQLVPLVRRDWQADASSLLDAPLPPLGPFGAEPRGTAADAELREVIGALGQATSAELLERLQAVFVRHGSGELARYPAFRWQQGRLQGIADPDPADLGTLINLERQLAVLRRNTEAFLAGLPAQNALLYGPRGSGKSTAVRGLLSAYQAQGLRLVEIAPEDLHDLPAVAEQVRGRPHRYLLFVDDLAFEHNEHGYRPLKSLLEGTVSRRPENLLVYATSNRRHLVRERFADRPDPLDDDVHAWDTQHERLALADRFGLTITFPDAGQRQYLEVVMALAAAAGFRDDGEVADLAERALRFAAWGNGYSGRTARQFVDRLIAERALTGNAPPGAEEGS